MSFIDVGYSAIDDVLSGGFAQLDFIMISSESLSSVADTKSHREAALSSRNFLLTSQIRISIAKNN